MSTIESPSGAARASGASSQPPSLLECMFMMFSDKDQGGYPVLIGNFYAAGMGAIVESWLGSENNLPITTAQIHRVLGRMRIQWLADTASLPVEGICARLVEILPDLVKNLSPDGRIPDQKTLASRLELMRRAIN